MTRIAVAAFVVALTLPGAAFGMNQQTEKETARILMDYAEKAKDPKLADAYCLAATKYIMTMSDAVYERFKTTCFPIAAKRHTDMSGVYQHIIDNQAKLHEYAEAFRVYPLSNGWMTKGYLTHWRNVANTQRIHDEAMAFAAEFVAALPKTKVLTDNEHNIGTAFPWMDLVKIASGTYWGKKDWDKNVLPEIRKKVEEYMDQLDTTNLRSVALVGAELERLLGILKTGGGADELVGEIEGTLKMLRDKQMELFAEKVAETRMVSDNYTKGDRAKVEAFVREHIGDIDPSWKKVLRISIGEHRWKDPYSKGWWTKKGEFVWGTWKTLPNIEVAVDTKAKGVERYKVIPVMIERKYDVGTQKYGPFTLRMDAGFPKLILKKNIDK